jgi:hypothetical protein
MNMNARMARLLPALALITATAGATPLLQEASSAAKPQCRQAAPAAGSWAAEVTARVDSSADFSVPANVESPKGDIASWEFLVSEGQAYFQWTDKKGSFVGILGSGKAVDDGRWHALRADVAQSGKDIVVSLTVDCVASGSSTITGKRFDVSNSSVVINPVTENPADVRSVELTIS